MRSCLAVAVLLCACTPEQPGWGPPTTPIIFVPDPLAWDAAAPAFAAPESCAFDEGSALVDTAFSNASFSRDQLAITDEALASSFYASNGFLDDAMRLPWLSAVRGAPGRLGCATDAMIEPIVAALSTKHSTASLLRHAAALLNQTDPEDAQPIVARDVTFDAALEALCAGACDEAVGAVDDDLQVALTPLLIAIQRGIDARDAIAAPGTTDEWRNIGGNILLLGGFDEPDPTDDDVLTFMHGDQRRALYAAAAQIAYAIEHVQWSSFVGRSTSFTVTTPAGAVIISGAGDDVHDPTGDVLLLLDLGGNDTYLGEVASNTSGANAVSIAIDLDGADRYGYPGSDADLDDQGLLPFDAQGRFPGNETYGRVSLSSASRQAAARNGIAMLFDLGGDDDSYRSLRASQGYAHFGAAALVDDGGSDTYESEALSQGAAQMGIALMIDRGIARDVRRSFTESQGFAFTQAIGLVVDEGGNDEAHCDVGDPALGGVPLYFSPQMPGQGNTSMCQGAAFGLRRDSDEVFLSGGVGLFVDVAGDDTYVGSLFTQGAGYWQGVGVLADLDGADTYDAFWYAQGGAAHYAIGVLLDDGDDPDILGADVPQLNVTLGSGHDFSAGVLINAGGDDVYTAGQLALGAGNCNGIGVFVDESGDDTYTTTSTLSGAVGHTSSECVGERPDALTAGVMIDASGVDTYAFPAEVATAPANDAQWGVAGGGLESEKGVGVDGEGESKLR